MSPSISTTLLTLSLMVSCSDGTGEEIYTVSCINADKARNIAKALGQGNRSALLTTTTKLGNSHQIAIDLSRDFSISSSPITPFPRQINAAFPSSIISQIKLFHICEPVLFRHQPPDFPEACDSLRRITISFNRETSGRWSIDRPVWEMLKTTQPPLLRAVDTYTQAKIFEDIDGPLMSILLIAHRDSPTGPLQPKMLWDLQQTLATISPEEPKEEMPEQPLSRFDVKGKRLLGEALEVEQKGRDKAVREVRTESLGMFSPQSREKAARMYRSACRVGVKSVWEDCTGLW